MPDTIDLPNVSSANLPGGPVVVPDVVGLTESAAEARLKKAGLEVGLAKKQRSKLIPSSRIHSTHPAPGTRVSHGSKVHVFPSEPKLTQIILILLFACLDAIVLALIAFIITTGEGRLFLDKLADKEKARGLITFLIVWLELWA